MKVGRLFRVSVLIILVLSGYQWLMAAYLTDIPVQVNQPNGTVIDCLASGDEYHNWLHDEDGYTIIQSPNTGFYTYAIQTGETVSASDFIVGITDPQIAGLTPGINISESEYQLIRAEAFPEMLTRNSPTTGTINNIVIFIHFTGQSEFNENLSVYNGWFNSNPSSLKNYFIEASYGQLTVNSFFYPPAANNHVVSWMSPYPREYYLPYSTSNTNGYHNTAEWQSREHDLLRSAVNAVSDQIPDNLNIDANNDGKVDNVVFIIRGPVSAWSTLLWPHRWQLDTGATVKINNKRVYDYNLQIQEHLSYNNVGVLCHEFCHTLGFPDLYNYDNLGWQIVGAWDVMGSTINPPPHMGAHMKWKYGHWIQSIPEISAHNHTYTLNPLTSPNSNAYRINSPNTNDEYFIVEYRDLNGTFEGSLTDLNYTPGMLIYRINTNAGDGNAHGTPEVYIYRHLSPSTASYSSQAGRTEINMTTDPAPLLSDGSDGGLQIRGVGPAESTISFRLGPPQAKIHGHIASASLPDNVYIPDLLVTLRRTDTHEVVSQTRPYWFQAIEYDLYADPGNYYIEYEIFQPSEGKFAYPIQSVNIPVEADSWINDITLPEVNLTFIPYSIHNVRVSSNAANPYFKDIMTALQCIQTAVNSGYNGTTVTLDVFPGDYYWPDNNHGDEYFFNYQNTTNSALSIIIRGSSAPNNPTNIEPRSNQLRFKVNRTNILFQNITFSRVMNQYDYNISFYEQSGSSYSFTGCFFGREEYSDYPGSSMFFDSVSNISLNNCRFKYNKNEGLGVLRFTDCTDVSITGSIFDSNSAKFGGAIHVNECDDVNITDCSFSSNYSSDNNCESIEDGAEGGAIYIYGSQNIDIETNVFVNNRASGGGGPLFMGNCSMFSIVGNMFKDNYNDHLGLDFQGSYSFTLDRCQIDETKQIAKNIIKAENNPSEDSHSILLGSGNTGNLKISNFVFDIDHPQGHVDDNHDFLSYSDVNVLFNNCVFDTGSEAVRFVTPTNSTITVSNSLFSNVPQGVTSLLNSRCNVSDMKLDSNYVPIWNQTTMSPCIDSGTGANDPDGTPADIGAIPAATHAFWDYTFRKSSAETQPNLRSDTWHWVSYPVINSLTQGKRVAATFFSELLGTHESGMELVPDVLQEILWKDDVYTKSIVWDNNSHNWGPYISNHNISSPQGYKIKLLPLSDPLPVSYPSVVLHHSGFPTSPTSPFNIHGSDVANDQIYENWIGYFDTDCQWPQDAFASIWNDIIFIKAKDWCLYRSNRNNNFSAIEGTMLPMKCGDMVVVATYSNHDDFQWETSNPVVPIEKEKATYFTYEEKPDYTPVEISLSGIDKTDLKEIALQLNGICKGAVVVKNDVEQLCAYLDINEKLTEGTVELIFYYESKSQPQELKSINIDRTQLSSNSIGGVSAYPVYHISVTPDDMANNTVPFLSLEQNYPNPFNPTTNIKYSLDEPGAVSLEIYNIKGQLVKTLVQGNADKGTHNVVWDGIDHTGNPCSSGVYFYKLRTNSKTLVRKMLMLK